MIFTTKSRDGIITYWKSLSYSERMQECKSKTFIGLLDTRCPINITKKIDIYNTGVLKWKCK